MTEPSRDDAIRSLYGWLAKLPDWLVVVLFLALAVVLALAGQLDDWLRAALAVIFGLLAVSFAGRLARHPGPHAEPPALPPPPAGEVAPEVEPLYEDL